eukprot:g3317.t1
MTAQGSFFPPDKNTLKEAIKCYCRNPSSFSACSGVTDYNTNINEWDVSKVSCFGDLFSVYTFSECDKFNGDIGKWNTSSVTNMNGMFHGVSRFNQDISKWNTMKVMNMAEMFSDAFSFNQDLTKWDLRNVADSTDMFKRATANCCSNIRNHKINTCACTSKPATEITTYNAPESERGYSCSQTSHSECLCVDGKWYPLPNTCSLLSIGASSMLDSKLNPFFILGADADKFIEFQIAEGRVPIVGVVTQSKDGRWVTKYTVSAKIAGQLHSLSPKPGNGTNQVPSVYTPQNQNQNQNSLNTIFNGNTDSNTKNVNMLMDISYTKVIRVKPFSWNNGPSMRVGLVKIGNVPPKVIHLSGYIQRRIANRKRRILGYSHTCDSAEAWKNSIHKLMNSLESYGNSFQWHLCSRGIFAFDSAVLVPVTKQDKDGGMDTLIKVYQMRAETKITADLQHFDPNIVVTLGDGAPAEYFAFTNSAGIFYATTAFVIVLFWALGYLIRHFIHKLFSKKIMERGREVDKEVLKDEEEDTGISLTQYNERH